MKKSRILLVLLLVITLCITGCSKEKEQKQTIKTADYSKSENIKSLDQYQTENPVVSMEIENYGTIIIELYPKVAPNTVNNFISLIASGFYDNNTFHRLIPGFVLQGGDPSGTGTGGPNYKIKGEFSENGFDNNLKHTKGIVSMARSQSYDSAGSQFFIMLDTAEHLDGQYAAFGKVIDGWDIIEKIEKEAKVANEDSGQLENNLSIIKTTVDLKNKTYKEVEKIK